VATYYKNQNEVKLKLGQTLGYTAGKGYYAAGKPTSPKSSPAPARTSSEAVPTATRPKAANTPTAPPTLRSAAADADARSRDDAQAGHSAASRTPKLSESTDHYTRPRDVPLKPGQVVALTHEHGYYAAGRPNPTRASTTPESSTTKVTALSIRASTESPLKENVETRDGRTVITLSHVTKPGGERASHDKKVAARASARSAKPHSAAAKAHKTRKASLRVDHELTRSRERAPRAKAANSIHRPDHRERATRRPGGFQFHADALLTAFLLSHVKFEAHVPIEIPGYKIDVSVEASVQGVELMRHNGRLVLSWGNNTLASVKLDGVLDSFAKLVEEANSTSHTLREALAGTVHLPSGETVTTNLAGGILSVAVSAGGVTTTIGLRFPNTFFISTEVSEPLSLKLPLRNRDVNIKATVEITPEKKPKPKGKEKPTGKQIQLQVTAPKPANRATPPIDTNRLPGITGLPPGTGLGVGGTGGVGLGVGRLGLSNGDRTSGIAATIASHIEL
jgi:hypothetical protein